MSLTMHMRELLVFYPAWATFYFLLRPFIGDLILHAQSEMPHAQILVQYLWKSVKMCIMKENLWSLFKNTELGFAVFPCDNIGSSDPNRSSPPMSLLSRICQSLEDRLLSKSRYQATMCCCRSGIAGPRPLLHLLCGAV